MWIEGSRLPTRTAAAVATPYGKDMKVNDAIESITVCASTAVWPSKPAKTVCSSKVHA